MKKLIISGLLMIAVIIGGCGSTGNDKDKEPGEPVTPMNYRDHF